jgi:uroporphyrinogen decarboxylase
MRLSGVAKQGYTVLYGKSQMNSKERVRRAVSLDSPDRIPILHSFLPGGLKELADELKSIFTRFPSDFSGQYPDTYSLAPERFRRYFQKTLWTDEWNCTWSFPGLGIEGTPVDGPFYSSWQGLEEFNCPDVNTKPTKPADADDRYVMMGIPGGRLFERMHFLRGFENLLMDIASNSEEMFCLRDKIVDWSAGHLRPLLEHNWNDCFCFMDDWGTQKSLLISPQQWREIFKPAYAKLFGMVRNAGKDIYFHSDGMIIEIVPDLIEVGVSILNCQVGCMDIDKLAKFQGKVCFAPDIDRQHLLPFGQPEEIKICIQQLVRKLATAEGGFIGEAEIGPDVSAANAEAAYRSFFEFRWV